jgi:hypothetical protein
MGRVDFLIASLDLPLRDASREESAGDEICDPLRLRHLPPNTTMEIWDAESAVGGIFKNQADKIRVQSFYV